MSEEIKVDYDNYGSRYLYISFYPNVKEIWVVGSDDPNEPIATEYLLKIIDTENPHQNDEGLSV